MTSTTPEVLWSPATDAAEHTRLGDFMRWCSNRTEHTFTEYDQLWEWSTGEGLERFWELVWEYFEVRASEPYGSVLDALSMPGTRWFEGARLNYAEHALRAADELGLATAVVAVSQSRERIEWSWELLADQVARARAGLLRLGVGHGDRVAAYLPNIPETIVAFLATASLGAIWTSCAPEFGVQAVVDRLAQVEPKVLLAVDGYRYGTKDIDRTAEVAAIRAALPTLQATVSVPYLGAGPGADLDWATLVAVHEPLEFAQVAPDHPLYILYSSGTTGLPKAIVHGHGGILLEHLKTLGLHADMGVGDRFFWFTTTGWMMWNYLVSGLLVGARVVLFDGDPNADGPGTLWQLAADERVTWFGVGAPYLTACARAGLRPADQLDLSALRAIGSTGAPLPPEGFRWVYESVAADVMLSPISGGTDVCSAFVGGSPLTPVWEGEIPCRYLGAAVQAFDPDGRPLIGEQGELVVTAPMPSMPVGFWGDDGTKLSAAYFDTYPGVWRHGDWITISERGSCTISGRSDATLNRGGVRIGTAELYRVVEAIAGVADSLVVHLEPTAGHADGELVLFVALEPGRELDDSLVAEIRRTVRADLSPRHVPDRVHQLPVVPTTLSGKKLEVPVKRVLLGADPEAVASRGSLKDPSALDAVLAYRTA